MMLTFPALNGIGLLTAETYDLHLMARAMIPMIALNGLLCTAYILIQRQLLSRLRGISPRVKMLAVLGVCLGLWGAAALWVAPYVQAYLLSASHILAFVCVYAIGCVPVTALLLWHPVHHQTPVRQRFWSVIHANAVRVGGMLTLVVLVMLVARGGAAAWAGRLSALPLIPFYSLLVLSPTASKARRGVSPLDQVGATVLLGPLVAIAFVWAFVHYLNALPLPRSTSTSMAAGVLGLLGLWGLCGGTIWGILRGARVMEHCMGQGKASKAPG
jgi:hypothetical protein